MSFFNSESKRESSTEVNLPWPSFVPAFDEEERALLKALRFGASSL